MDSNSGLIDLGVGQINLYQVRLWRELHYAACLFSGKACSSPNIWQASTRGLSSSQLTSLLPWDVCESTLASDPLTHSTTFYYSSLPYARSQEQWGIPTWSSSPTRYPMILYTTAAHYRMPGPRNNGGYPRGRAVQHVTL